MAGFSLSLTLRVAFLSCVEITSLSATWVVLLPSLPAGRHVSRPSRSLAEDLLQPLRRPRENRPAALLDDRPLDQVRMLHHQIDDLVIRKIAVSESQLRVD